MNDRELDVLLYGATGFTGKLVARELEGRGLRFAIAGRNGDKLRELRSRLASAPEAIAIATDNAAGLVAAARRSRVVLTCAGPYAELGRPLQDAALAAGAHYVDVTGEAHYMLDTWKRDSEARAAGIVLLNAAGFDVVPTDLCAWLACRGIESPELVEIAFATGSSRLSHGTMKSMIGGMRAGGLCYENGIWVPEPPGRHVREVPFPQPLGPRHVFSAPWGDVVTGPRTTGARNVRVYMVTSAAGALLMPATGSVMQTLARTPLAGLAEKWIESSPAGPTDAERAASKFTIWAQATAAGGRTQFAIVEGRDPYGLTAVTSVYLAGLMAADGYERSGALTPCQAADPMKMLDALSAAGLSAIWPEPSRGLGE